MPMARPGAKLKERRTATLRSSTRTSLLALLLLSCPHSRPLRMPLIVTARPGDVRVATQIEYLTIPLQQRRGVALVMLDLRCMNTTHE